jgi:predicted DNA-binding transcriptional regulator YafY
MDLEPREPQPPATPGRAETDRIVAPYGLVFHAARWYLAADDERSGEIRTFRVDRVRSAELRAERANPPEGFDDVEHVERSIAATPWGWRLEIVFDTTLEEARRRIPLWVASRSRSRRGCVLLRAHADDLNAAARMLASLGCPFTVREPAELRQAIQRVADVLVAAVTSFHRVTNASLKSGWPQSLDGDDERCYGLRHHALR